MGALDARQNRVARGALPTALLRYEWPQTQTVPESPLPRAGSGRILLAWSAAGGAVPAKDHEQAIREACAAGFIDFKEDADILPTASLSAIAAKLEEAQRKNRPLSVLHILCHGGQREGAFGLMLEPAQLGQRQPVDASRLAQVLAPFADMVRLVVVMACGSDGGSALDGALGSIAQALHRAGFASVVASRYLLSRGGSVEFTETLYRELLVGPTSLEQAIRVARTRLLRGTAGPDWASVQLYARTAEDDDTRPIVFRPYAGLAAFDRQRQRFFFGREALSGDARTGLHDLYTTANATRLLAILGPSGSGKSSVARAGLRAALAEHPLPELALEDVAIFRPGPHPVQALHAALQRKLASDDAHPRRLLVIDQLEELYTLCAEKEEQDAFVSLLLAGAAEPTGRLALLVTLRTDFLEETLRWHPELNRVLNQHHILVGAMSPAEYRDAIARPAERAGRPLDEVTIERLLHEMSGRGASGSEVALPLLEFALANLWEGMQRGEKSSKVLEQLGGVGGAVAGKADQVYASLSEREQATARRALVRLVQLGEGKTRDTRRRMPLRELCGRGETEATVHRVLLRFSTEETRLISLAQEGNERTAEVTHEALFQHWAQLRDWINADRKDRPLHDRATEAARQWLAAGRPVGMLWRPPLLEQRRQYHRRRPDDFNQDLELS